MIVGNKKAPKRKRGKKKVALTTYYNEQSKSFIKWLTRLGYAEATISNHGYKIVHFFAFLQNNQITDVLEITPIHLHKYHQSLQQRQISGGYIKTHINTIKSYCSYLEKTKNHKILHHTLATENSISTEKTILTQKEIKQLFSSLENTPIGLLHRSLLHLCYSCGLRVGEAVRVHPKHIDYSRQLLFVVPGKNYQGRYIPISSKIANELQEYEQYARSIINPNCTHFLVNRWTDAMHVKLLAKMFKRIQKQQHLQKHITLHGLRHSIATHLLQKGMELEYIQQFLGHKSLEATQIYVRITNEMIYQNDEEF